MATIRFKGAVCNDYFAEQLVKNHGAEHALANPCGPMLAAVKRVLAALDDESKEYAEPRLNG